MARYDVRNVCNHGVLIGLICTAFLMWSPFSSAKEIAPYWIKAKSNHPEDCVIRAYPSEKIDELEARCIEGIESFLTALYSHSTAHWVYLSDLYGATRYERSYVAYRKIDVYELMESYNTQHCQNGEKPVYPATDCVPKTTCDSPEIQQDFQQAQYACQLGNPNTQLWETDYQWSCQDVVGQNTPNITSRCNYVPNNCIVGLTCEKAGKDVAHCDPSKETCALPPQTEKTDDSIPDLPPLDGSKNGAGDGTAGNGADIPNFCDLNPQLCEKQQPPEPNPEPNPTPTEKPDDAELSAGDNAIVGEVSISNQHLENVNSNLKSLGGQMLEQLSRGNEFSQHQLGLMRDMLEHLIQGDNSALIPNETGKEEKPKEEEQEKTEPPMASADCDKSIFECRGDVIQCALLKVQYDSTCTVHEFAQLEEAFKGIKLLNNEALLVQSDTVDYSRINKKYLSGGVSFGGGGCPAPERISFRAFGETKSIEFKFDPACHYAELLRPLLIAFAWLTGLFIIGRTQGAV